ncbi:S-layer homology domain-containing protein, partial [Cohnella sp.]|uniref:S-layer homology domain-containing protein n=1 Tax=Cohnella sp. TaxID=1883426 RepID=UPI00370449D6
SVTLAWNPSTDAFGVAGYRIYIGGSQVGTTSGATAYKVTGLTANTPYSFTVKAYDAKGNLSAASQSLTVRTACAGICGGIGGGPMLGNSEDENTVTLTNRDIPAASDGKISIDVKDKSTVVLPDRITELVGKNDLEVRFGDAIVSLPPEVLAQLSQLQSTSGLSDASMRLTAVQLNPAEVQGGLASDPSTEVAVFSPIYELKLAVVGKNGEEKLLSSFKTPITVRFPVNPGADRRLTGIYYIADNGKLEYIGGRWEGNELVAELSHFSKYGVFEIKKNFEDVAAKHWALSVIQELAAKQIVNGITDTKFAPEKKVTRSEFAAMLVKALRLKPAAVSTAFEDVPKNAWYSEAVAAAYAHGLIKGLSDSRFAPQEQITREQMAIMVMNAYKISLKADSSEVALEFKDSSEISRWAQTSVTEAGSLGLMKGRNGNLFAPKDNASRAEAVQVISNLLQQLSQ